jgi:hypothetical protein
MIKQFLNKQFVKNKAVIINEGKYLKDFMRLLMKHKNTGEKWTKEEKKELKSHMKRLSLYVPVLIIFALPFGSLMLPLLTEVLDRRNNKRAE